LESSWFANIVKGQKLEDRYAVTQLSPIDFLVFGHALQHGIDKEAWIHAAMYRHPNKEM